MVYVVNACVKKSQEDKKGQSKKLDYSDPFLIHVASVDEDARRLHREHMQKGCRSINFQAILDDSHPEGKSTEKIICQLRCKAIVNLASLGGRKYDIVGECSAILTENIDPMNRYRRIYFVQASCSLCLLTSHSLEQSLTRVSQQAGEEYQKLESWQESEKFERSEKWRTLSHSCARNADSIQTTTRAVEDTVTRTTDKKYVNIKCTRQTVSHMEVLHVEEQLVQIFCEQVGPGITQPPSAREP